MHHLALSPASWYLLMLHYFPFFIVYFAYILAGQTSEIQAHQNSISFMVCSSALTLQCFFLFVAFLWFASLFLFQLYTAGDKTRHNGQGDSSSVNYELLCCGIRVCVALLACSSLLSEQSTDAHTSNQSVLCSSSWHSANQHSLCIK